MKIQFAPALKDLFKLPIEDEMKRNQIRQHEKKFTWNRHGTHRSTRYLVLRNEDEAMVAIDTYHRNTAKSYRTNWPRCCIGSAKRKTPVIDKIIHNTVTTSKYRIATRLKVRVPESTVCRALVYQQDQTRVHLNSLPPSKEVVAEVQEKLNREI